MIQKYLFNGDGIVAVPIFSDFGEIKYGLTWQKDA